MQIVFDIPDEMAHNFAPTGEGLSRAALEALALEGYRTKRLTESELRRILGFESRFDVHAFLKEHDCYLHYSQEDFDRETETIKYLQSMRAAAGKVKRTA